ncbi:hypothetical protein D9757_008174 [Collybiopsis confluens]|uniref:BAG domain-containing protein n=1 Tax=Collybiopsis confluens TaxID=2823264 RepID=A0A8H5M5J6_9AGAR|nr:hypothetical protein D9757_008174 [Collybiopsis confluens]
MFHFISPSSSYSRPQSTYHSRPQSSYLSQLLAEREERELLRRLDEIQLQKQRDPLVHSRRRRPLSSFGYDSYSPYYPEDEEFVYTPRQRQHELEIEYLRRKAEHEAEIIALKRHEEELRLKELALRRQQEESRLRAFHCRQKQLEASAPATQNEISPVRSQSPQVDVPDCLPSNYNRAMPEQQPTCAATSLPPPQTIEDVLRLVFNSQRHAAASAPENRKERSAQKTQTKGAESPSLDDQRSSRLHNNSFPPATASTPVVPANHSEVIEKETLIPESSGDVRKALDSIRNIETTVKALQSSFSFPSQIDFSPASSRSPSPARGDEDEDDTASSIVSETDTGSIRKLGYTPQNYPIRSYEQSLTRLLVQLDEIESHGNSEVRVRRRAVVGLVERALDKLEKEVEEKWNVWNCNQSRRVEREVKEGIVEKETSLDSAPTTSSALADGDQGVGSSTAPSSDEAEKVLELSAPSPTAPAIASTTLDQETVVDADRVPQESSLSAIASSTATAIETSSSIPSAEQPSYAEVVKHSIEDDTIRSSSSFPSTHSDSDSDSPSSTFPQQVETDTTELGDTQAAAPTPTEESQFSSAKPRDEAFGSSSSPVSGGDDNSWSWSRDDEYVLSLSLSEEALDFDLLEHEQTGAVEVEEVEKLKEAPELEHKSEDQNQQQEGLEVGADAESKAGSDWLEVEA